MSEEANKRRGDKKSHFEFSLLSLILNLLSRIFNLINLILNVLTLILNVKWCRMLEVCVRKKRDESQ